MNKLATSLVCVKRSSRKLDDYKKADLWGICPGDTSPCSPYTSASDTICIKDSERESCPIIDLFLAQGGAKAKLQDAKYTVLNTAVPIEGNSNKAFLAFSTQTSRADVGMEPILDAVLNTVKPCYGGDKDALIRGRGRKPETFGFDLGLEFSTLESCPTFDWRRSDLDDDRYD
mmetsp:Transcript_10651/g.13184  ORF Transcript_10651/g.13184 Transcript_10651/m.13184 type:complete len:173 (+) Transcript_10651:358-876(+)|eukprot:CAMPEP_0170464842 /NCGR_PEP_ID=MMETSP0123-20130129/9403_1 /TAXON_ID=182087 /ORGANISM="Favella ehrenbergii, Strain Fehren 1" /LENGTH=172 /DNA_ID=CAMNT_0010730577 /DNA_START=355 /DNA_END=873 /DNA_ORIENTATION=+